MTGSRQARTTLRGPSPKLIWEMLLGMQGDCLKHSAQGRIPVLWCRDGSVQPTNGPKDVRGPGLARRRKIYIHIQAHKCTLLVHWPGGRHQRATASHRQRHTASSICIHLSAARLAASSVAAVIHVSFRPAVRERNTPRRKWEPTGSWVQPSFPPFLLILLLAPFCFSCPVQPHSGRVTHLGLACISSCFPARFQALATHRKAGPPPGPPVPRTPSGRANTVEPTSTKYCM